MSPSLNIVAPIAFSFLSLSFGFISSCIFLFISLVPTSPFLLGVIICTLLNELYSSNFFNPSLYKDKTKFKILSWFASCTKKKSFFNSSLFSSIKYLPEFTLCALSIILLLAACLNILSSTITFILPDAIMSLSILPGPTEGSWSTSPTSTSFVPSYTAISKYFISAKSIIDVSSTITTSASIGSIFISSFMYFVSFIFEICNSLCNVLASSPVVSVIFFAALPVGAQSTTFFSSLLYNSIMLLIIVVFPVPGPPVITQTLFSFTANIPSLCLSESSILFIFSIFCNFSSILAMCFLFFTLSSLINFPAMNTSAS